MMEQLKPLVQHQRFVGWHLGEIDRGSSLVGRKIVCISNDQDSLPPIGIVGQRNEFGAVPCQAAIARARRKSARRFADRKKPPAADRDR